MRVHVLDRKELGVLDRRPRRPSGLKARTYGGSQNSHACCPLRNFQEEFGGRQDRRQRLLKRKKIKPNKTSNPGANKWGCGAWKTRTGVRTQGATKQT